MSKSKPQETTQATDTSTKIPDWLENTGQTAVSRATDLSNRDYQAYTGQIVAPQSADTLQSYQQIRDMQGVADPAFASSAGAYRGLLGSAAPQTAGQINDLANQLYGGFSQNVLNPAQNMFGAYTANAGPATAGQVGANAQALMSPYNASVIAPTLAAGEQQREIARQAIAKNANDAGAFGGSRQGVAEGVSDAQINLGTQKQIGDMLTQGWGQALTPGYNLASQQSQQGYNADALLAGMGQSGYANAGTQATGIGNQNLTAGLQAAQMLPGQAVNQANLNAQLTAGLGTAGAGQQGYQQQLDNAQMAQFYEQQGWGTQNLNLLLGALGGVPYSTTGTSAGNTQQTTTKNAAGGILGGALSGAATGATVSGGNPYVAGAGAIIGGIGGAF